MFRIRRLLLLAAAVLPAVATGCNPFTLGLPHARSRSSRGSRSGWTRSTTTRTTAARRSCRRSATAIPPPICEDPPSDARSPAGHAPRHPRRAVRLRGVPRRHRDRQEPARGQDRPAAVLPAGRPGPAAPLPLGMHDLLHRDDPVATTRSRRTSKKTAVEVVYIDKDHLHLYVGPNPDMQRQITQELTKY